MNLKVTERFRRVSDKSIEYRATMEDASTWTKPWSIELAFNSVPGPLYEYASHEGNTQWRAFRADNSAAYQAVSG